MQECKLNQVFANRSEEGEIFLLLHQRLLRPKKADDKLKHCFKRNAVLDKGLEVSLIDDTHVMCKDGRMIIPNSLQSTQYYGSTTICSTKDTLLLKKQ
jgi:hypothetical protein